MQISVLGIDWDNGLFIWYQFKIPICIYLNTKCDLHESRAANLKVSSINWHKTSWHAQFSPGRVSALFWLTLDILVFRPRISEAANLSSAYGRNTFMQCCPSGPHTGCFFPSLKLGFSRKSSWVFSGTSGGTPSLYLVSWDEPLNALVWWSPPYDSLRTHSMNINTCPPVWLV